MRPDAPLGTCPACGFRLPTRSRGDGSTVTVLHRDGVAPCRGSGRPTEEARGDALASSLDAWAAR